MQRRGLRVPEALCISTDAYMEYVLPTGLRDQMRMALFRKPFDEMRWEEIWDTALRIRNLFIKTPMHHRLKEQLWDLLAPRFSERPVSVRSSAPGEDAARTSFAGLHEFFVNIRGLVDGTLEPDRWILDRGSGRILSHHDARREKILVPVPQGVRLESFPHKLRHRAPLRNREVKDVYGLVMKAETLFGSPQDVEWTYSKQILHALQARPITTLAPSSEDQRPWYLSLHRSFDNLRNLRTQIETELIPRMEKEAHEMSLMDFSALPDSALAQEIRRRRQTHKKWKHPESAKTKGIG